MVGFHLILVPTAGAGRAAVKTSQMVDSEWPSDMKVSCE